MFRITNAYTHHILEEYRLAFGLNDSNKLIDDSTHTLLGLVVEARKNLSSIFLDLKNFIESEEKKQFLMKQVDTFDLNSFEASWSGALTLVRNIATESDKQAIEADIELLFQDLNQIMTCLLSPSK